MRCALLGPTPGSRPSSSIRSWTAPSYITCAVRQPGRSAGSPAPPDERAHLGLGEFRRRAVGVADRGDDEILQASRRRRGRPRPGSIVSERSSPEPVTTAVTRPPPAVPVTSVVGELGLRGGELLLHLLGLLHQLLHVRLLTAVSTAPAHDFHLAFARVPYVASVPVAQRLRRPTRARQTAASRSVVDRPGAERRPQQVQRVGLGIGLRPGVGLVGVLARIGVGPRVLARSRSSGGRGRLRAWDRPGAAAGGSGAGSALRVVGRGRPTPRPTSTSMRQLAADDLVQRGLERVGVALFASILASAAVVIEQ